MDKSYYVVLVLIILMAVAIYFVVADESTTMKAKGVKNDSTTQSNDSKSTVYPENVNLAPRISGQTPDGGTLNVADLRGKVVVVDFWASWCAPCRQFIPTLSDLYSKYKDKGLEIVGVYIDQNDSSFRNLNAIKNQLQDSWPQIVGEGAFESAQRYNVQGIPHIALIAKDGSLVFQNVPNRYDIERYVQQELAK